MKDANADELIEKLPTVTVENGTLKAQGENVTQVLVDGKPFFGNDPTAALKNLPAEVIDKIQIFDQQSEQSQFTGFQDGNTTKTINIVTKTGMRNGQFGKVYAGYGYEDKYQAGGNINYFDGDRRISLLGMTNNINVQNFSSDDIVSAMGGGRVRVRHGGMRRWVGACPSRWRGRSQTLRARPYRRRWGRGSGQVRARNRSWQSRRGGNKTLDHASLGARACATGLGKG